MSSPGIWKIGSQTRLLGKTSKQLIDPPRSRLRNKDWPRDTLFHIQYRSQDDQKIWREATNLTYCYGKRQELSTLLLSSGQHPHPRGEAFAPKR